MKSFIGSLCILCLAWPLFAEVGLLSLTSEDMHTKKEDFWHTFEYYATAPDGKTTKCQATRIGKKWFATAAHCVAQPCQNGCTLQVDLLEQPFSVLIGATHTRKKPIVFIHSQYKPTEPVAHDFALLQIDVARAEARYYRRAESEGQPNLFVSKSVFDNFIRHNPPARRELEQALRPQLPPLLVFSDADARLARELSVISIFNGERHILHNPYPTDYVKQLGFAYTLNFGVKEGMSGSGVMTNTGELAGIISAYLGIKAGKGTPREYFMFAVFNADLLQFMEQVMGSDYYKLDRREAAPGYIKKSTADHTEIITAVKEILAAQ